MNYNKLSKSLDVLVKEKRQFKQHLARREGKISIVKQHEKLIEVNPDKDIKKSQNHIGLDEFINASKEIKDNIDNGKSVMDVYRRGIHTIHDAGMEKDN